MKKAIIELLYNDSNLKGILEQENFHTFSLDYYSKSHIDPLTGRSARDAIETALRVCHHFIDTFSSEFHNILLYGDTGVGKTFITLIQLFIFLQQGFLIFLLRILLVKEMRSMKMRSPIFAAVTCLLLMILAQSSRIALRFHNYLLYLMSESYERKRQSYLRTCRSKI